REPVHVAQDGVVIRTPQVSADSTTLQISVRAENPGKQVDPALQVVTRVFEIGPDEKPVGNPVAAVDPIHAHFPPHETTCTVEGKTTLANPKLWSPESPQ